MKEIAITKGLVTLVDDEDYTYLNRWHWSSSKSSYHYYAVRNERRKRIYMHRFLAQPVNGQQVHHIDGNTLNNQRGNLQCLAQKDNLKYRKVNKNSVTQKRADCVALNRPSE